MIILTTLISIIPTLLNFTHKHAHTHMHAQTQLNWGPFDFSGESM